jgi:hypothetical protein
VKQRRHGIVTTAQARDACECSTLFRTRHDQRHDTQRNRKGTDRG